MNGLDHSQSPGGDLGVLTEPSFQAKHRLKFFLHWGSGEGDPVIMAAVSSDRPSSVFTACAPVLASLSPLVGREAE